MKVLDALYNSDPSFMARHKLDKAVNMAQE
jgi:hypothetical protein